jgi:LuxR family transcriptional regulator, maltose regulon positive regulatory protein
MTMTYPVGRKTSVARLPEPWLRRSRLNESCTRVHPGEVLLVAGFAGSGKTSLLADWFTHDRTIEGAWLALDARDDRRGRFATFVATALGVESALSEDRRGGFGDTLVLDHVIAATASGEPRVLVVDDVHELTSPRSLQALDHLLQNLPANLALVLATRADPPVSFGRLRVEGRLHQLRPADLALTLDESAALLGAHGVVLAPDQLASLHERTDGWVAGVCLAALALGSEPEPARFVEQIVHSEAVVSEYLMHEVLDRLPHTLQQFLVRTSIVQPLTVELAELLSEDHQAATHLAFLEQQGIFVTPVGPSTEYRFHSLFGALLRAQFWHDDAELARKLSARAADWYLAHDDPEGAEEHAFAAEEWELAGRLACERWIRNVCSGLTGAADVASAIPESTDVAGLALLAAINALVAGDRRSASMWRSRTDALLDSSLLERASLRVARLLFDVLYAREFGADTRAPAACRALLEFDLGAIGRPFPAEVLHATVRLREAELALELDDEEEGALRALLDARWRASRAAARAIVEECDALLALVAAVQGRLDACDALLVVDDGIDDEAGPNVDVRRLARALADAQRGRTQSARALVRDAPAPSTARAVRLGIEEAARRLEFTMDSPKARVHAVEHSFVAQVRIALGALDDAPNGSAEVQVAAGRVLLTKRRDRQVVELLERFARGRDQHVHPRTRIEAAILVSIAADRLEDSELALLALRRALDLAAPADLRAPLIAHATAVGGLLDRYAWQLASESRYAADLVDDLHRDDAPVFVEPLTDRERAVLDYLPTMMSNAEIAAQLLVSVNTIKTHLKAVYRKLGVERRRDAVVRARQLELL